MGGYSVISPAQVEVFSDDQKKEVLGQPVFALFEPVLPPLRAGHCPGGGIYFAGEHTATQETPATLEGAVHSGNKVGHQIPMRLEQVMECRRLSRIE